MEETMMLYGLGALAVAALLPKIKSRLELSLAKHPSLTGHSRMARRVAAQVPFYDYDDAKFFCCDGAPIVVVCRRPSLISLILAAWRLR